MKFKTNSTPLTPPPVAPTPMTNMNGVLPLYDKYYAEQDPVNESHYRHGKMIDKEITGNHITVIKSLLFMLIDDIKTDIPEQSMHIEKVCKSIISCVELLPEGSTNVTLNKRIAAKLLGYTLELHKLHI